MPVFFILAVLTGLLEGCSVPPARTAAYQPDLQHGMALYAGGCGSCHDRGEKGAPALNDPEEWDMQLLQQTGIVRQRHDRQWLNGQVLSGHDEADALAWIQQTLAERNPEY